jgi:hypothetical protein
LECASHVGGRPDGFGRDPLQRGQFRINVCGEGCEAIPAPASIAVHPNLNLLLQGGEP